MKPKDMDTDDLLDELIRETEAAGEPVRSLFRELDKRMRKDDCPAEWGGVEEDNDGDEDE